MIFNRLRRLSYRNYGCRRRPRYLIFSQFSICCCQNAFAFGALPGPRRGASSAQAGKRWVSPLQRATQIAGPWAPRPHDPPLSTGHHVCMCATTGLVTTVRSHTLHWYRAVTNVRKLGANTQYVSVCVFLCSGDNDTMFKCYEPASVKRLVSRIEPWKVRWVVHYSVFLMRRESCSSMGSRFHI